MKLKKIFSLGLAAISVFAMSATALAAPVLSEGPEITVASGDSHSYDAYQIFTGAPQTEDDGSVSLTDIKWGENANLPSGASVGDAVPQSDVEALQNAITGSGFSNDKTELNVIKNYVDLTSEPAYEDITVTESIKVQPGYYLFKDRNTISSPDTYSQYIVRVAEDVEINRKAASKTPTVDKTVGGKQGTTASENDIVTYDIKVTLPDNISAYSTYRFIVTDALDTGLTLQTAPTMKYYSTSGATGTAVTLAANTVSASAVENGTAAQYYQDKTAGTMTICSGDIMSMSGLNANSYFIISYTAKLNSGATDGSAAPNDNDASLKYSNNPNVNDMSSTNRVTDIASVYTFKLVITEEDNEGTPVKDVVIVLSKDDGSGKYVDVATKTTGTDGKATFDNIGSGDYKIRQTVPGSFADIEDIPFNINGEIDNTGTLTALTTDIGDNENVARSSTDVRTGVVAATITNHSKVSLPVTGTIGLVILGGAALAACGTAIGMRIKSRKEDEDED